MSSKDREEMYRKGITELPIPYKDGHLDLEIIDVRFYHQHLSLYREYPPLWNAIATVLYRSFPGKLKDFFDWNNNKVQLIHFNAKLSNFVVWRSEGEIFAGTYLPKDDDDQSSPLLWSDIFRLRVQDSGSWEVAKRSYRGETKAMTNENWVDILSSIQADSKEYKTGKQTEIDAGYLADKLTCSEGYEVHSTKEWAHLSGISFEDARLLYMGIPEDRFVPMDWIPSHSSVDKLLRVFRAQTRKNHFV
ncbi:hypothetical protein K504DRAFT_499729 [Pleomassaria siparia CBS 279.74]|uniref:Uncharacterized protein n=1 Tax=Pleomassaria siparia CBS 279.74 TaxID=1314801 RepID=A0A6G1KII2_9PLEO|nr:hypothetical protein K504DRAFT_499729 [Pleomassaria siparia CBS 279.74]